MKFFVYIYNGILKFLLGLIDANNPLQVHNLTNLLWGVGSFFFYWTDHFINKRLFTTDDYWFIIGMCGLLSTLAVANNKTTKISGAPVGTPLQSIEKKEESSIGES